MPSEWENNSSSAKVSTSSVSSLSASSSTATSPEPNANGNNNCNSSNNNNDSAKNGHGKDCALKASTMSHDPTQYVARARVTRPTPPKPSCNPMQFVQIKPCNLYQSAQQQLKKAEEIKKVKEVKKEEPEDWQNNLDNWKSSRRKRVEHIIDRVVEVKKLELEEFDRQRRKSKTFSEMMEERGERGRTRPKLQSLDVYNEDEANDLSDLGIGTSSASGKSSISEDCETHSIVSEPAEVENLSSFDVENNSCQPCNDNHNRDRISSPGYETSSTAPVTSPVPYEYTYEGAIEDYKSRVSKATASSIYKKPSESNNIAKSMVFERKSIPYDDDDTESKVVTVKKEDLPKVDISKKRELFEKPEIAKRMVTPSSMQNQDQNEKKPIPSEFANVRSIKDRLCSLERKTESTDEPATGILSGEITSIKERLQCLEQQKQQNSVSHKPNTNKVVAEVVAVPPLKERLSCLQNAVTKEEVVKKPIVLVDEYQLEMLKNEEIARRQLDTSKDDSIVEKAPSDDSGINTTDEKIDHDAITTEDEDEDNEPEKNADATPTHDEKFKQNLNTPTVVSSVAKPIVVDVGGGSTMNKSSDENGEVNHAQNLLKMFKMAFDGDEVVAEEKITPIDVSKTIVDRVKLGNVGKQESESALQTAIAPWQSQVNRASKIPQALMRPVEPLASESKKPSFVKVASIEEILKDDFATVNIPMSKDSNIESSEVSIKQVETPRIEVEKSKIPITSANSSNERSHEMGSHLILNIDNSQQQKKSQIPVASKTQPNSPQSNPPSPSVVIRSQNIEKPSSPALARKDQNVQKPSSPALARNQNVQKPQSPALARNSNIQKPSSPALARSQNVQKLSSPVLARNQNVQTPSSPGLASNQNVQTPSSPALARNQNIQAPSSPALARHQNLQTPSSPGLASNQNVQTPSSPALARNENQKIDSPIYENMSFDADISRPSACVGLKKVVPSQNNGRIEIFNSKSMGPKPKSPEVLPRIAKSSLNGDLSSQMQSKDFQSAVDDFYKNLESWQPKIVGEQPKDSSEPVSSVDPDLSTSNDFKEEQVVTSSPTVIPKSIESEKVAMSTPKSKEIQKVNTSSLSKKSPDPLPFESCVDILKSFLAAERSYPNSYNKPEAVVSKESNQVDSRAADRYVRQETIVEVPCTKLDVKDLPDPNFIRTPCIDVDCGDKVMKDSMIAQAQIRDSLSSAGDSSPSSEITVIFKPTPGSPTPNKSSLMQIANRVASPTPARRDPLSRQQPVTEKPCLKLDVKDLPDPNFIKTPCIDVQRKMLTECSSRPNSPLTPSSPNQLLHKTNADILKQTCEEISNSPPLSPVLGREPSAEKPNFLIARVEVVETKIKVTTTNDGETAPPPVPSSSPPSVLPGSPKAKPKSAQNSKPKNIFEFLKKNFQSKSDTPEAEVFEPISVDNSKFYVPSDVIATPDAPVAEAQSNNGVNIEITKTITTDAIVEQTDDELNLSEEINEILDEEISKLVVEDAKL